MKKFLTLFTISLLASQTSQAQGNMYSCGFQNRVPDEQTISRDTSYSCANNKTIKATFRYSKSPISAVKTVTLSLDDGRKFDLSEKLDKSNCPIAPSETKIAASLRENILPESIYAVFFDSKNNDVSNGARGDLLVSNTKIFFSKAGKDYSVCKEIIPEVQLTKTFSNNVFSVNYPENFIPVSSNEIGEHYVLKEKKFTGIILIKKFEELDKNFNLHDDTFISVETAKVPTGKKCNIDLFGMWLGYEPEVEKTIKEGNVSYQLYELDDAGMSKTISERVFIIKDSHSCVAIRYYYGSTAASNYDGMSAYNEEALIKTFDAIRRSIVLKQK